MCPEPPACRRLVVLRGGALGDGLVTLPALAALRAQWPAARLTLLAYPHLGRLALAGGLADEARSLDGADMATLFAASGALAPSLRGLLDDTDLAVNFLADPDGGLAARLRAGGVRRVFSIPPPMPRDGHVADALAMPLVGLGVRVPTPGVPHLHLPRPPPGTGIPPIRPGGGPDVMTLQPGSGSVIKNWPLARYVALARVVARDTGLRPVFVLGEAEAAMEPTLAAAGVSPWVARAHPGVVASAEHAVYWCSRDLMATAALLSEVRLHVGNDSGISHLAAALGTPVVALFGPSDPAHWAPRGRWVRVLRSDPPTAAGLATLTVQAVAAMIGGLLVEVRGVEPLTS